MSKLKLAGLGFVFIWFFFGGVGHFVATDFFVSIVPPYIPEPRAMVYISGVFELLGAIGILFARWRSLAGIGLVVLILAVTPANIYMWQNPALFPDFTPLMLDVRMVIQVLLIACVIWSTRAPRAAQHA
ncbi:DoxX family protein [Stenotrophobium rhamnosiphilum]|uniref:DoxX family protein n=1 Tax=Stenotrophobium rhamnosiphilum TaxID=2029166 RepID=A0A2T5MGM8_9GAMM|nr:hypothetical protein [Stenotrophobium rhamnosiphilum]PTU31736.1 hypothetical protein CJD38_10570 [Stenotrophobium rhamnosiphilum]